MGYPGTRAREGLEVRILLSRFLTGGGEIGNRTGI